jgi:hypothetical protein
MGSKIAKIILLCGLFFSGCASKVPPPLKDISNAKIALSNASEAGAAKFAPKSFTMARRYYKQMRFYMDKKLYQQAKYAAQKAHIQAKLAYTKTQKQKVKKDVDTLATEVNSIQKEFTTISQ